jgi:signal transduction histidine kinase/streptogramin lyase
VAQLLETADRRFWLATNKGLVEFFPNGDNQGRHFRSYTERNGLSYHGIIALNEDLGGNLWLGTSTEGAMKLARNGFVTYNEQDGLYDVNAVFEERTGSVCFKGNVLGDERTSVFEGAKLDLMDPNPPTFHQRFGCFDGQRFNWFQPKPPFPFGWVMEGVTLQAREGEWWVGSGQGLFRFPATDHFAQIKTGSPLAVYTAKDGLAAPQVFRLFEDSRNNVWISTISPSTNGLARWERSSETIRDLGNSPGLPSLKDNLPRSFGEDRAGNVWIGFNNGLARYARGSFEFFTAADGLPPGSIMNIYLDHAGRLWLASARAGLVRLDDSGGERPSFVSYATAQGLSSNNTEVITEDVYGHLYVGGGHGLDRFDPMTGRVKHFTTADGLGPGLFRDAFRDHNGVLWFGMTRGLSRYAPSPDIPAAPPSVLISGLRVGGSWRLVSALGEREMALSDVSANDNQLQLDFVGLSFVSGDVLRYQYKLEGADDDWSASSDQRRVNYANLAPGRYRFLVRASNSDGTFSRVPASVSFTILRPVWQRWWFFVLAALAVGLGVYMLYRYRISRIIEFANMRTRIATDLHDEIGSNLSLIAMVSEVAGRKVKQADSQVAGWLSLIGNTSRETVDSMSDIVWAVNPNKDRIGDLTQRMRRVADDAFTAADIAFHFSAPTAEDEIKVDAETRREVFMVFKEGVNNIVRHSRCTKAEIQLAIEGNWLRLKLSDNGRGFDVSEASSGNGLSSMRRRAEKLGGELEISSSSLAGTAVTLKAPLYAHLTAPRLRRSL